MKKYFLSGLLLIVLVGIGMSLYWTPAPVTEQAPEVQFGGVSLTLDYATTTVTRELGLGGRTNLPDDYGMLFVFKDADSYGFWMKDMLVPLDIFWLNDQGQVVYIEPDVATSTYPDVFYPTDPALYVLETAAGFARAHNVTIGTPLIILKNFPTVTE
ncbi:MAG: DUF192 domain-containing protein [Patescibacteria group bacterium]|nr:DUF192 domain-containing protein [Patescibacteria group bacterium]